jgi:hypothetical protein
MQQLDLKMCASAWDGRGKVCGWYQRQLNPQPSIRIEGSLHTHTHTRTHTRTHTHIQTHTACAVAVVGVALPLAAIDKKIKKCSVPECTCSCYRQVALREGSSSSS